MRGYGSAMFRPGRVLAAATLAAAALLVAGCTSQTSTSPATTTAPATAAPTPAGATAGASSGASDIALTCAVASAIGTTTLNAYSGYKQGKISAAEYAGAVNTVPFQYSALTFQPDYGLKDLVAAAKDAIEKTPPSVDGAVFDPMAQPYSGAADAIAAACDAHHVGLQIAGEYGG